MAQSYAYNENVQRAKLTAGFKGGNIMINPRSTSNVKMYKDGVEPAVREKLQGVPMARSTPTNPWYSRSR